MEYSYRCSLAFGLLFTYFDVAKVTDGAVLEVKPKANVVNGGFVSVSWRGIKNPTKDDWLGFYCPKNDSDTHKIHKLNPSNWSAGHGTWKLDVYNMRSECEFRYFGVQNGTARMAVRSQPLTFENGDKAPLQGHIALTGNPTEMRVMWTSSKGNYVTFLVNLPYSQLR